MNILIIGGTGYMGKLAVQRLLDRGDRVTVFSRGTSRPEWWDRVEHIRGDRENRGDFIYRLKGKAFDAAIDTQAYRKEDVEAASEALRGNVGRYLLVSTSSVYLEGAVDFFNHCPYDESVVDWTSLEYTFPVGEDPYAVGKRHCEKWLQENSAVPYTIVRIPAVMGPDDPTGRMWWWAQRALDGGGVVIPSDALGAFRTFYSADAAANFIRILDYPGGLGETYFIGMPEIMTVERWAHLVWGAAGHNCKITYVPRAVIRRHESLRSYSPPLTRPLPNIHDTTKARRDFGIVATPVEEWVQTTVDWYRNSYSGGDSDGYRLRGAELSLADRWEREYNKLAAEF